MEFILLVKLCILIALFEMGYSARQHVRFSGPGINPIFIDNHIRDLSIFGTLLNRTTQMCGVGMWGLYPTTNFDSYPEGGGYFLGQEPDFESPECYNVTVIHGKESIRYFGAPDTTTPAISFYSNELFSGIEHFTNGYNETINGTFPGINIRTPNPPLSYVTTGSSDWTFFTEFNLGGESTCVKWWGGNWKINWELNYTGIVKSVLPGCTLTTNPNF